MTATALRPVLSNILRTAGLEPSHPAAGGEARLPLSKSEVAELSDGDIRRMTRQELVHMIQTLLPWELPVDAAARLAFQDRTVLERLSFQARRTCRLQGY